MAARQRLHPSERDPSLGFNFLEPVSTGQAVFSGALCTSGKLRTRGVVPESSEGQTFGAGRWPPVNPVDFATWF